MPAQTDCAVRLSHLSADDAASSCGKDVAIKDFDWEGRAKGGKAVCTHQHQEIFFPESQEDYLTHIFQKEERKVRKVECATS